MLQETREAADSSDPYNLEVMENARRYNVTLYAEVRHRVGKGDRVLDFGAGRGLCANRFERQITCVEPDQIVSRHIARQHVVCRSLSDVEGHFDFVYSLNVLEHIEDDAGTIRSLSRVMSPGARLFLLLPARGELFSEMDRHVGHYRRYTPSLIRELLEAGGFQVQRVRYFDFAGYWCTVGAMAAGAVIGWKGKLTPRSVETYDRIVFPVSQVLDRLSGGLVIGKNILVDAVCHPGGEGVQR